MTFAELKIAVQAFFPVKWEDTFMNDEDSTTIDKIINIAINYAKSRFEKIESTELTGSQMIDRAQSVVQCSPSLSDGQNSIYGIFNIMAMNQPVLMQSFGGINSSGIPKIKHRFNPDSKMLLLIPYAASAYVEYVVDTSKLTVEDLDDIYTMWTIDYANALLMIKEGLLGIGALPNVMPFEFNYAQMKDSGEQLKKSKEDEMMDMYQGTLAIRVC